MLNIQKNSQKIAPRLANYHVKIKSYTGPFDVLLQLIAEQKVDIEELDLAKLTEDYVLFLKSNLEEGIRLAPEFIQVAALLILIKTSSILSESIGENFESSELPLTESELIKSLRELEIAKKLQAIISEGISKNMYMVKAEAKFYHEFKRKAPPRIDLEDLLEIYNDVFKRNPVSVKDRFVSNNIFDIKSFEERIIKLLSQSREVSLLSLAKKALKGKKEIIGFFLAALKLAMAGKIELCQEEAFKDIKIVGSLDD